MVDPSTVPHVTPDPGAELRNGSDVEQRESSTESEPRPEPAPAECTLSLPAARSFLGLTRADQWCLALLSAVALALMIWHWARLSGWGMRPVEVTHLDPQSLDYRIDVNTATWVEWTQLDGIGEALAERIVADREANGPFRSIDDLRRVKGIGPKTLARIRRFLTVGKPARAKSP